MSYTDGLDNPELHFQSKLYAGNSTTRSITFDGSENMQPDWVWIKERDDAINHYGYDSVRGTDKRLQQNINNAESTTDTTWFNSFNSNGFTIGSESNINNSSSTYASWNWKAGGSASSNSDGSITSSVSANTTAGFSIVSYTGSGSNATVGHGLGVAPAWYIVKQRDAARSWNVYHKSLGATKYVLLENTAGSGTDSTVWNDTEPTSTTFSVGTTNSTNASSGTFIAYCFAEKKGYSKFGSYTGNGNADGKFVYLGFRPAMFLIKSSSNSEQWEIMDNKRDDSNVVNQILVPNGSDAEIASNSGNRFFGDFLSNGVKFRGNASSANGSGISYIYMAFAESPFVNSNGVPNNAR